MLLLILYILVLIVCIDATCPRDRSKIVRKVVQQEVITHYNSVGGQIPLTCPLHPEREIYGHQEANKHQESPMKWICEFCGKGFYEERWLDMHFRNRHPDTIRRGDGVTCLADYCDVFRCDVLTGSDKSTYWDAALCKDADLHSARSNCNILVNQCTPTNISPEEQTKFRETLKKAICGFLTCKDYWELPDDKMNPLSTAIYIMAAIILAVALMVYYYVVYSHFYTDESLIKQWHEMDAQYDRVNSYSVAPGEQHIRHRGGTRR